MTTAPDATRFIRTDSGYLMVLRQGDDVFAHLIELMRRMGIPSASLVGLGFGESDFATLLVQEARNAGLELKPENVAVDDGLH